MSMGWFESQIQERTQADEQRLESALKSLSDAVTGQRTASAEDTVRQTEDALEAVLGYYGVRVKEPPRSMTELSDLLNFHTRPAGIMYRDVRLTPGWQRDAVGAMLGATTDGAPVALLPAEGGYYYRDPSSGSFVHVDGRTAANLREDALCFYRPLPSRELTLWDLVGFMLRTLDRGDYVAAIAATAFVAVIGLVLPLVNNYIFGPVVAVGDLAILVPVLAVLIAVEFSQVLINGAKAFVMQRVTAKVSLTVQSSVMMRVLMLPASFFKDFTPGALHSRIESVDAIASILLSTVLGSVMTAVFSLVYIFQIFALAPALTLPAFTVILVTTLVMVLSALVQLRVAKEQLGLGAKLAGWQLALIQGIQKIRLAGAEQRGFATWAERYAPQARLLYNGPLFVRLTLAVTTGVTLVGAIVIYTAAFEAGISVGEYMAFSAAYGMVSGAFLAIAQAVSDLFTIRPHMDLAEPLFKTVPEVGENRPVVERVSGAITVDNLTFAYREGQPPVLNNLSLSIRPGQYVAVVGKSGCGKSTLMRLLLGFEKPQKGAIYYDSHDLDGVDVASIRRNIGVVLQDGKLFAGDIFSNITISAPMLSMDDAWEAAEMAGFADDIRSMPMGMFTMISEGSGGISGGQKQRLMIARAIAPKPKILIFDEATSALDNVTQRRVVDSLDKLRCTRIVVAHRLSTIQTCDRIILLEDGAIAEDGTYEELMEKKGAFYELVKRQQA